MPVLILIKPVCLSVCLFAPFNCLTYLPVHLFTCSTVLKLFTHKESIQTICEASLLASMATCGSHRLFVALRLAKS